MNSLIDMETLVCVKNTNKEIKNKLIYEFLFGIKIIHLINLDDYCSVENRQNFRTEIREILDKGQVRILDDRIIHTKLDVVWKLEIKK